jgi:regulatory NSL complex subunit 3
VQQWFAHLSTLGQVVTVIMPTGAGTGRMAMTNCLDQMIAATRSKISELKTDFPGRPVILIGWNTGAAIACQVSKRNSLYILLIDLIFWFLCRYMNCITY